MIGVYFAAPIERYTRLWAMSGVLTALGMTLIFLNFSGPPGFMLMAGNVLLFAGCVVVWIGLRAFFGWKISRWAYSPIALFAFSYFLLIENNAEFAARACLGSTSLIIIFLLCLQTLLARTDDAGFNQHRYARKTAIAGLLILIAAHTLRLVVLLGKPVLFSAAMTPQLNAVVVYMIPLAGTVLFFPALLLLYFERVKHQLLLSLESKQEALEIQTRFVEMFSHEYRTPLAVIRTNLDILQSKDRSSGQHFGANLEKMQRAVLRLVEVADTAMISDQHGDGNVGARFESILMPDFLGNIIAEARDFWSDRAPQFTLECSAPAIVDGDRTLLKTAFLNVLDNAIKYGPNRGIVRIQLRINAGTLLITVEDNGPGIPEPELDLVYGKYFRGSRTGFIAGSGIGLYLVLRIIGQHAGSISLSNRPEGGASVTITLPLSIKEGLNGGNGN